MSSVVIGREYTRPYSVALPAFRRVEVCAVADAASAKVASAMIVFFIGVELVRLPGAG